VLAEPDEGRIVDGLHVLGCHRRSYDKAAQLENAGHVAALVECWRARAITAAPTTSPRLRRAAERGDKLGTITAALLRLLDRYGASELESTMADPLERNVSHPHAVRLALERRREQRSEAPPVVSGPPAHLQAVGSRPMDMCRYVYRAQTKASPLQVSRFVHMGFVPSTPARALPPAGHGRRGNRFPEWEPSRQHHQRIDATRSELVVRNTGVDPAALAKLLAIRLN